MDVSEVSQRLSRITTLWTLVYRAHGDAADEVQAAQDALMQRYGEAVHRYLCGALRDDDAADELFQEFCLRLVRGAFRNATPERGRFRDFLKTSVFHLIVDHHKRQRRQPQPLSPQAQELAGPLSPGDMEKAFLESWREQLVDRTFLSLHQWEAATGQPHFTVLRFRTDHPDVAAEDMANRIGAFLGRSFTAAAVRQALHRARDKFADLLIEEVARSLSQPTPEEIEAELIDLGLHGLARAALERRSAR